MKVRKTLPPQKKEMEKGSKPWVTKSRFFKTNDEKGKKEVEAHG